MTKNLNQTVLQDAIDAPMGKIAQLEASLTPQAHTEPAVNFTLSDRWSWSRLPDIDQDDQDDETVEVEVEGDYGVFELSGVMTNSSPCMTRAM